MIDGRTEVLTLAYGRWKIESGIPNLKSEICNPAGMIRQRCEMTYFLCVDQGIRYFPLTFISYNRPLLPPTNNQRFMAFTVTG